MAIENDDDLEAAVIRAGELLQDIHNYVGMRENAAAMVRIARGAIRSADYFRSTFPRFMAYDKRTTCAYTLMYLDTMWWVTHRTDVSSVAREMCYKSMIVAVGTVLEAVLRVPGEPGMGNGARGVRDRVDHALNRRWIDQRDADLLKELWQHRNRIHAHKLTRAEFGYYTKAHVDRPARALRRLVAALKEWDDARR